MSKIARYQGNVRAFASDAQGMERTVFGGTNQADDLTSQITASFLRGWGIVGASEHPSLEDFNAAMYAMSQFIAYQHQMGVPEWHAEQEYHIGSICTHNGESYQSLQNANIGSQPPSAKWTPVLTSKNGLANLGLGDDARLSGNLTVKGGVWDTAPGDTPERVWSPNNKPSLATLGVVDATTTQKGIIELATNAEMATGTSSSLVPSVAAVMSIFSKRSFSANDYVRIPDVPCGLIIQWVSGNASANGVFFAQMPIPFPNKLLFAGAVEAGANVWGTD
ncbi:hypothetical protein LZ663_22035, partial [Citrobacter portucalensis]|nr:hypothetical protein [Citrobacter portucalensis]